MTRAPKICPVCQKPVAAHDLDAAFLCLEALSAAARELSRRACGGAMSAELERERNRPSPTWRT